MASPPSAAPSQGRRRQPSRLQQRAPASLQVTRSEWNIAIPLLSPLTASPTSPNVTALLEPPANDGKNAKAEAQRTAIAGRSSRRKRGRRRRHRRRFSRNGNIPRRRSATMRRSFCRRLCLCEEESNGCEIWFLWTLIDLLGEMCIMELDWLLILRPSCVNWLITQINFRICSCLKEISDEIESFLG